MEVILPSAIGGVALVLTIFQEMRHWLESRLKLQVDVRTMWTMRGGQDAIVLVVVEILAFNPSMRGIAISHVRLEVRDAPKFGFDLARPKRVGAEWELEPLGSRSRIRVSGDLDLPYTLPPITLPARQGDSAVLAFAPTTPFLGRFTATDLRLFARVSSHRRHTEGFLHWRKLVGKQLPAFDEIEARWLEAGIQHAGTSFSIDA